MTDTLHDRARAALDERKARHTRSQENIERIKRETLTNQRQAAKDLIYKKFNRYATDPGAGQYVFCGNIRFSATDALTATVHCQTCQRPYSTRLAGMKSRDRAECAIGEIISQAERCIH